jgi:hypothetical protein
LSVMPAYRGAQSRALHAVAVASCCSWFAVIAMLQVIG